LFFIAVLLLNGRAIGFRLQRPSIQFDPLQKGLAVITVTSRGELLAYAAVITKAR
jgi:hypothetical protein